MKRTRDSTFGPGDFNTSVRRRGGEGWEDRFINYLCQGIASKISALSMMSSPTPATLILTAFTVFA